MYPFVGQLESESLFLESAPANGYILYKCEHFLLPYSFFFQNDKISLCLDMTRGVLGAQPHRKIGGSMGAEPPQEDVMNI